MDSYNCIVAIWQHKCILLKHVKPAEASYWSCRWHDSQSHMWSFDDHICGLDVEWWHVTMLQNRHPTVQSVWLLSAFHSSNVLMKTSGVLLSLMHYLRWARCKECRPELLLEAAESRVLHHLLLISCDNWNLLSMFRGSNYQPSPDWHGHTSFPPSPWYEWIYREIL